MKLAFWKNKNTVKDIGRDDYEPQPINKKKVFIILSVFISIVTGAVLIWGFAFGGFAYKKNEKVANDFYSQIFIPNNADLADSKAKALKNIDNFEYDASWTTAKQDLTALINDIYDSSKMSWTGDINNPEDPNKAHLVITGFTYGQRKMKMTKKVSRKDMWFQFTDETKFGGKMSEPKSETHPWPMYMSRLVLIRVINKKIASIGFFGTAGNTKNIHYIGRGTK